MSAPFPDNKQKKTVSVRELAEFVWRRGDLNTARRVLPPSMIRGAEGHRWLQGNRPGDYLAEITLATKISRNGITLEISGRADGVFTAADPPILEEIKTTTASLLLIREEDRPTHWAQAKLYGAIYVNENGLDALHVQLTYLQINTREVRSFRRSYSAAELAEFLNETTSCYLDWLQPILAWREERTRLLDKIEFPFPVYRPGQEDLEREVYQNTTSVGRLFVQAPTGSGKTMAVLFGALRALGEGEIEQVVFLTAKTVGRLAAEEALAKVAAQGTPLKALTLTARNEICFHPDGACTPTECPQAEGHFDRLLGAARELMARPSAQRADVEEVARGRRVCPYWLSRELVRWVDVVIGDYNYAFDPRVSLLALVADTRERRTFLVDEAHNLVERAREMFSADIRLSAVQHLEQTLGKGHPALARTLGAVRSEMLNCVDETDLAGGIRAELMYLPENLFAALGEFCRTAETVLTEQPQQPFTPDLTELYFEALAFLRAIERRRENDIIYVEKSRRDLRVKLLCLDPSARLRETLEKARGSAVFFSATLSPMEYFTRVLGGGPEDTQLVLASSFPAENRLAAIAARIPTKFRTRDGSARNVAEMILAAVEGRKGNYIVYFPSYKYLSQIAAKLDGLREECEMVVQKYEMTGRAKASFLSRFDGPWRSPTLIGFAVLGGVFSEGIDLTGERLSGAIVISPGLPKVCVERELIREYFARVEEAGFEFAYLYPGMNKVVQAAGRVLRSETDRGILVFVGERFAKPVYRELLPPEWAPFEYVQTPGDLSRLLESFW